VNGSRIFVSSTYYDLIDARAELEVHLRELGLSPIMSDRLSSDFVVEGRGDSIETCLVNLRNSDIVIVILSQRYGPPLPDPYGGRSATHVEYDEAVALGKPIHFYARDKLLGDYAVWRRDHDARLDWVKDERQRRVFELLEARESRLRSGLAGADAPSNWVWPFRDSLELKERVAKDLRAVARAATMRRLIRAGELPAIAVSPTSSNSATPDMQLTFSFANAGSVAAMNVRWTDHTKRWRRVGVMPPNAHADAIPYSMTVTAGVPAVGEMLIYYETATGHRVMDTFNIHCNANLEILPELKSRELLYGEWHTLA
jgi:hypothetical protein